jgi:hypothetical protein
MIDELPAIVERIDTEQEHIKSIEDEIYIPSPQIPRNDTREQDITSID